MDKTKRQKLDRLKEVIEIYVGTYTTYDDPQSPFKKKVKVKKAYATVEDFRNYLVKLRKEGTKEFQDLEIDFIINELTPAPKEPLVLEQCNIFGGVERMVFKK